MKKSLLFAFVACFAMGASAQSLKHNISAKSAEVTFAAPVVNKAAVAQKAAALADQAMVGPAKARKKVAVCDNTDSSHSVWGTYYEILPFDEFTGGLPVTVELETDKSTGDQYAVMSGLFRGFGSEVYGIYDKAAKTITIPAESFVGTYNYQGQELYLCVYSVEAGEEEDSFNYRGEFDEEGNPIALYDVVFNVVETEDGLQAVMPEGQGWFLNAYSGLDADAEYLGGFAAGMDETIHKANYWVGGYITEVGDGGWTDWAETEEQVYVEKYDESLMVYGLRGQYVVEFGIDPAAGTCELVNQPLWYYDSQNFWFSIHGCYVDGNRIMLGDDDYTMTGMYSDEAEYLAMFDENEQGEYFYICSDLDADGRGYFDCCWSGFELYSMCGRVGQELHPADGIDTVLAPSAKAARYTLAGQRTNTYVKGINIEGGKKVVR